MDLFTNKKEKHCWIFPKHEELWKLDHNKMDCWITPKLEKINLEDLIPNFDHCKTLYTKCDYDAEACVHEQLLKLESQFQHHQILVNMELARQNILVDRLWVLSQRFLLLTNSGVCIKPYPEYVSHPTEQRILCEFHEKLRKLKESNYCVFAALERIKASLDEFHKRCDKLDQTVESVFMLGNESNMPLSYTTEIITDLYDYFHTHLCRLRCWEELIDPGDSGAIEDYMELIKPMKDYESYLIFSKQDCGCLRSKNPVC